MKKEGRRQRRKKGMSTNTCWTRNSGNNLPNQQSTEILREKVNTSTVISLPGVPGNFLLCMNSCRKLDSDLICFTRLSDYERRHGEVWAGSMGK